MAVSDELAYEARTRPRYAVIAGAGGIALLVAAGLQSAGAQAKVSEVTVQLIATSKRTAFEIAGAVVSSLGILALAITLTFLFSATKARKPDLPKAVWMAAIAGGVLSAVGGIAYAVLISIKAHQFVTHGAQTYDQANTLLTSGALAPPQYAGLLGSLLLAVAFVLIALNAMRVGLLTKFLGYLGIAAAAASLLLIGSPPALLIEIFWLMATGYLLIGRWPGGDPQAWRTGEAEPWPSAAQLREQRQAAGGGGRGAKPTGGKDGPAGGRARPTAANAKAATTADQASQTAPEPVGARTSGTRATTPKRKRKRRK